MIKLIVVLGGTALASALAVYMTSTPLQKLLTLAFISGLCLYSGVGGASSEVPTYYLVYYFAILVAFVVSFKVFCVFLYQPSRNLSSVLSKVFSTVDRAVAWRMVIWITIGLHLLLLIYPEFRLHLLFAPPAPDLVTFWARQWAGEQVDAFSKILEYLRLLLMPFFYVALYRYRNRITRAAAMLLGLLYIRYVATGYVGRGMILMAIALIGLVIWIHRPRLRPALVVLAVAMLPLILLGSYAYGVIRLGGPVAGLGLQQMAAVIDMETSFPREVGVPIIESGRRVNLWDYAKWIVTLPIPKVLTGEIGGARVNYEISEAILGISRGDTGWFVVLPGFVAEAVYIFGPYLFWLHAVFVALLAAWAARVLERTPQFLFLAGYVTLLFGYVLNRGGISAMLPVIINEFLLFYVFILLSWIHVRRRGSWRVRLLAE